MAIAVNRMGTFQGRPVDEAVLLSDTGVRVHLMNWGVSVRDWQVPVVGGLRGVALGFDRFDPYPDHSPHLGSLAGRVANRIRGAQFVLNGRTYILPSNQDGLHLHGGPEGLGRQVWDMAPDSAANAVKFSLFSPAGHMGYPSNVQFTAIYSLSGNRLKLQLSGMPDAPTPISLVQHIYFNLGLTETICDHSVQMPSAVARTLSGPDLVPTGVIQPVGGTVDDFLSPRTMRDANGTPQQFDLNYVLATGRDPAAPIAIATGEDGALTLKLWSDRPGLQFYNAVWTDIIVPGHNGRIYGRNSGFCFEDQMFPDALHNPHFPDIICTPDRPYSHSCEIEIA